MSIPLPFPTVIMADEKGNEALDPDGVQQNFDALALASPTAVTTAWSTYRHIFTEATRLDASAAGTYAIGPNTMGGVLIAAGNNTAAGALYIDPADYLAGNRTTRYRVRVDLLTNATASTSSFTVGLYPVTASAGVATVVSVTLGAVTAGSTVLFTTPAASNGGAQANSGDFTAPAAGYYLLGVAVAGAMAANSSVAIKATLQMRQA